MPSQSNAGRCPRLPSTLSLVAWAVTWLVQIPLYAQWSPTWSQVASTGPTARASHAMAYDSQRGRTVLFGGFSYHLSAPLVDTVEWDGTSWLQRATGGPSARYGHAMAYDSQRGRTVLFGGINGNNFGDTWEWDGSTWAQVATNGPVARSGHAMAYDSVRGRTVLFGGGNLGDTWEWTGAVWVPQLFASGPGASSGEELVYDSQSERTLLFVGGIVGQTWEWDGTNWAQVTTTAPTARSGHAMAYDSVRGRTVLFGGLANNVFLGDTWEFNRNYTSTSANFGSGCGNPTLVLSAIANARPTINTTAQATLTNVPSSLAFVALGWSRTVLGPFPLPLTLAGYGMPGCDILQSCEAAAQPTTPAGPGTATFSLALPNWSGLIGLHLYLQGWAVAPGANAGNTIVSNGLEWGIGNS